MMEHSRKQKLLMIFALVFGIVSLTIGFAAFSATLNISSSANVSPNSDNFRVEFCEDFIFGGCRDGNTDGLIYDVAQSGGALSGFAKVSGTNVNGLHAIFYEPGQFVRYTFSVQNLGEYDAYLKSITYSAFDNGSYKKCTASTSDSTKATDLLVQDACEGIRVVITIGGTSYELGATDISGHILSKGEMEGIRFDIEYVNGAALADGPFEVEFSDFKLNYSTVDGEVKLVNFKIDGVTYTGVDGMTLEEWVNSSYNKDGIYINNSGWVCTEDYRYVADSTDIIREGAMFSSGASYSMVGGSPYSDVIVSAPVRGC